MDEGKNMLNELSVINIGLVIFAESLAAQKARVVQVDWSPPAGGDEALQRILSALLG